MPTSILTNQSRYSKVTVLNANIPVTFVAPVPSTTKPTVGVVLDTTLSANSQSLGANLIDIMPWSSIGTNTLTYVRVIGWKLYPGAIAPWYIPRILGEYQLLFTSGTKPSFDIDGVLFPFTGVNQASATPGGNVYTPYGTNNFDTALAHLIVDIAGSEMVTIQFRSTGGTPNMGAFVSTL